MISSVLAPKAGHLCCVLLCPPLGEGVEFGGMRIFYRKHKDSQSFPEIPFQKSFCFEIFLQVNLPGASQKKTWISKKGEQKRLPMVFTKVFFKYSSNAAFKEFIGGKSLMPIWRMMAMLDGNQEHGMSAKHGN